LSLLACVSGFGIFQLVSTNNKNRSVYCSNNIKTSDQIITIGIADFGKQNNQINNIETDIELELRKKLQYPFVRICRIQSTVTSPLEAKNLSEDWSDILGKNGLIIWGDGIRIGIEVLNTKLPSPDPWLINSSKGLTYNAEVITLRMSSIVAGLRDNLEEQTLVLSNSLASLKEKSKMKKDNLFDLYEIYHNLGGLYYADCEKTKSKCQEALNEYRNIDSTYPYYPYIILDITFLAETLGNYELAFKEVNKLINMTEKNLDNDIILEAISRRARLFLQKKQFDLASKDLEKLLELNPANGRIKAASVRADYKYQVDRITKDLDYVQKSNLGIYQKLEIGEIYFQVGDFDKSQQLLKTVICGEIDEKILFNRLRKYNQSLEVTTKFIFELEKKKSSC
jgi:tetratricopeptide (TPR) repeat protein